MYVCSECGTVSSRWQGKCFGCGAWNTLVERPDEDDRPAAKGGKSGSDASPVRSLSEAAGTAETAADRTPLPSPELARALGGGIVPGSFILLSWEPGIGKSTLALQIAAWYARDGRRALYASAEETVSQLANRAERLGIEAGGIDAVNTTVVEELIHAMRKNSTTFAVVDSVSMMASGDLSGAAGSMNQIRAVAELLMEHAKRENVTILLIGHVTKDGAISGPKALEHIVDTVLFFEGVRHENYRMLRVFKNRFGPTDEVGLFRMTEKGLEDMENPGTEFVSGRPETLMGSALGLTMEGSRAILFEVEALTTYTKFGYPKRSARGIPGGKLDLAIAIANKYASAKLDSHDVYLNISRGLSISEPGSDLAALAALLASRWNLALGSSVFLGEVSLTGMVRPASFMQERVKQAKKMGIERIVVPTSASDSGKKKPAEEGVHAVRDIAEFVAFLRNNFHPEKNARTDEPEER